jgi:hypothetical protein
MPVEHRQRGRWRSNGENPQSFLVSDAYRAPLDHLWAHRGNYGCRSSSQNAVPPSAFINSKIFSRVIEIAD